LSLAPSHAHLLGTRRGMGRVVCDKRKGIDATFTLPFGKTVPKITLDASCSLVAFLGGVPEHLHDDFGDRNGDIRQPFTRTQRLSGDMAMHPLHGLGCSERQGALEHV